MDASQWMASQDATALINSPVLWSGLIAAGVSLLGVALSNWNSRRQLRMQLDYAAQDKLLQLKREVFLRAADWAQTTVIAIHRLSRLELGDGDLGSELAEKAHVIAEVEIVANEKTIECALRFNNAFGATFSRLAAERRKLDAQFTHLKQLREAKEKVAEGSPERSKLREAIEKAVAETQALYLPFTTRVFDEVNQTVSMAADLTLCMRAELGLPIDASTYREIAGRLNDEARQFQKLTTEALFAKRPQ